MSIAANEVAARPVPMLSEVESLIARPKVSSCALIDILL
jgi:hypothetical protein